MMRAICWIVCAATLPIVMAAEASAQATYVARSSAAVTLSASGGVPSTVLSVQVPAGNWVADGVASVVNFGAYDFVRCDIKTNGVSFGGHATNVGSNSGFPTKGTPAVATIATQAAVKATVAQTFTLDCLHDANTPSGKPLPYVDPAASMIIRKVTGGLIIQ